MGFSLGQRRSRCHGGSTGEGHNPAELSEHLGNGCEELSRDRRGMWGKGTPPGVGHPLHRTCVSWRERQGDSQIFNLHTWLGAFNDDQDLVEEKNKFSEIRWWKSL